MITIYCVTYNEEVRLSFMLEHYKTRFPNNHIVIFDNGSTDNTVEIAAKYGCEIIAYNTDNKHNDDLLTKLKNSCWKNAKTDWVLVCDPDELLDITEQELKNEELLGTTIIKPICYNMVNLQDNYDLENIKYGRRSPNYDKLMVFNKKYVVDINYNHGSHIANPIGVIKYNDSEYKMYHYHFINPDFVYSRYQMTVNRFSEINKKQGWGIHCHVSRDELNKKIATLRKEAIKVIS